MEINQEILILQSPCQAVCILEWNFDLVLERGQFAQNPPICIQDAQGCLIILTVLSAVTFGIHHHFVFFFLHFMILELFILNLFINLHNVSNLFSVSSHSVPTAFCFYCISTAFSIVHYAVPGQSMIHLFQYQCNVCCLFESV